MTTTRDEIPNSADLFQTLSYLKQGVGLADAKGVFSFANPTLSRLLQNVPLQGLSLKELGAYLKMPRDRTFDDSLEALARDGSWEGECTVLSPDGHALLLDLSLRTLAPEGGAPAGTVILAQDITRERSLERKLMQSQQMELVESLSSGIAHEFKNLLTVIMAYASLLQEQTRGEAMEADAAKILETAERANDLITRLLAVTRRSTPRLENVDLRAILADLTAMLRKSLPETIRFIVPEEQDLPEVFCDPAVLYRALLNVCLNARDAMPEGGDLTIELNVMAVSEADAAEWPDLSAGSYLAISIADTGGGMTPDVRERIFEPFFTTKKGGTGLGLSVVDRTIKSMGGWISVYSEPGVGSCFRLYIPVARTYQPTSPPAEEMVIRCGAETVLAVDDDPVFLTVILRFLQAAGYKVWTASSGEEAIKVYRQHSKDIALVLLDLVMPYLNGRDVYREILSANPKARVLFISGFSHNTAKDILEMDAFHFLAKPFTHAQLSQAIRELLDSAADTPHS